ncbi:CHAT domain-containing protein [Actinoplanes sp. NEAU-A12]|uniref:CHAT domain-containing protein n=1 Tax=Actinoplanes sandaracinus TaxID=3045177 RepID=A0ABT6WBX5_9ACTN|nr:CHAT domain-containing protein [Actinoplanes sandaracinus]MDI6097228.1 CHAT domain-containing protein [Actinoplanes sandaracinus]
MIDDALADAYARIRGYQEAGQAAAVLDAAVPELIRRVVALANALDDADPRRVIAVHAVGTLRWCRFQALPAGREAERQAEMLAAINHFDQLYRCDPKSAPPPELIPPEIRALFDLPADLDAEDMGGAAALTDVLTLLQSATEIGPFSTYLTMLRGGPKLKTPGHLHHPLSLAYLAIALRLKGQRFGDHGDLTEAVRHGRAAVDAAPPGHLHRSICLGAYGNALLATYHAQSDPDALDLALVALRAALDAAGPTDENRPALLCTLGGALTARAVRDDDGPGLDEAITLLREALPVSSGDTRTHHGVRGNLSQALTERHRRLRNPADLDEAVRLASEFSTTAPPENSGAEGLRAYLSMMVPELDVSPGRGEPEPGHHAALSRQLLHRFIELGRRPDADGAVRHGRLAVEVAAGRPDEIASLVQLGAALQSRLDRYGDPADLREAVENGRRAVRLAPAGHPERAAALSHFGVALRTRFGAAGDARDLDEAVEAGRASVDAAVSAGDRAGCQSNLALALRTRADVSGNVTDLDEAVAALEDAAAAVPATSPRRHTIVDNLAETLRRRSFDAHRPEDLDVAIERLGETLRDTDESDLRWGFTAAAMASALRQRYDSRRDPDDLELAVVLGRRAVAAPDATGSTSLFRLTCLARALRVRGELNSDPADLTEAIDLFRRAGGLPGSTQDGGIGAVNLGAALWTRAALTGSTTDTAEATDVLNAVVASELPPRIRINAAVVWGRAARWLPGDGRSALHAFESAVSLLPLQAWRGIDDRSRERALTNLNDLPAAAAGAAIAANRPDRAVELVEQSRAIGWTQRLELRSELGTLTDAAPEVAARLATARAALQSLEQGTAPPSREERITLARAWDRAVAAARQVPGFHGFLRPPEAHELYRAAAGGPVVVIGAVEPRCSALIVTVDGVTTVELPTTAQEIQSQTLGFLAATQVLSGPDVPLRLATSREEFISAFLGWLWDAVAGPVLDALGMGPVSDDAAHWPRLWWCPVGPMSLLPLHAAGHHARGDGAAVLDRVISSYTPTLGTLIAARERPADPAPQPEPLLVVSDDSGSPLPAASTEPETIGELLGGHPITVIAGAAATVEAVREALGAHRYFHFGGHGRTNIFAPSEARIDLADGSLGLSELTRAVRPDSEFAYLSACHTAQGGFSVPDEVMTLASAVQFAGCRHVLGSLWSVPDAAAGQLGAYLYQAITDHGRLRPDRAARALHFSVRCLRREAPMLPSGWAPFVHAGP